METKLDCINVQDITVKFKDKLFDLKCNTRSDVDREALKRISYLSNMYFYSNTYRFGNHLIDVKTQTGEDINNYSIRYLN